jgi:peptidyl-prolyl cis-trans isomerase C
MKYIVATFLTLILANNAFSAPAKSGDRVLVTINGYDIKESHFIAYLDQRGKRSNLKSKEAQMSLLNKLANTVLIAQSVNEKEMVKKPEVKAALEMARMRVLADMQIKADIGSKPILDAELKKLYKEKFSQANLKEYNAAHIMVKEKKQAENVIKQLNSGKKFADLVKKYSVDASKDKAGDLGWFGPGQVAKPFSDAVAKLKKGAYTRTPIQTQFGWHVVRLLDTRSNSAPPMEEVKANLVNLVRQKQLNSYLDALRAKSKIQIGPSLQAPAQSAPKK